MSIIIYIKLNMSFVLTFLTLIQYSKAHFSLFPCSSVYNFPLPTVRYLPPSTIHLFILFFFLDLFIFWERESAWEWVWEGGEGERESQTDALLSMEPNVGLDLMTLRSWPELKSKVRHLTNRLSHPGAPQSIYLFFQPPVYRKNRFRTINPYFPVLVF